MMFSRALAEPRQEDLPATSAPTTTAPREAPSAGIRVARLVDNYLWIVCFALAAGTFGFVWTFLPHVREGVTLPEFILKITAFLFAVIGVAFFPQRIPMAHLLLTVPSLVFLGFIIPRMMWLFLQGPHMEPEYYTYLWALQYPGILLSVALAYRIGGGNSGTVLKLGLNGLILVFSGYLEVMWFVVNPWNYYDMPSIPHIEVLLGFKPTYGQLVVFALAHVPLLLLVNLAPFNRWIDGARRRIHGPDAVMQDAAGGRAPATSTAGA